MLYESLDDTESATFSKELLKDKVISGGIWMHAMLFSKRGLDLILTIILAQLLSPETFGVIGVFYIVSSAFGRTIVWRNIRYKLLGPTEIIVEGPVK